MKRLTPWPLHTVPLLTLLLLTTVSCNDDGGTAVIVEPPSSVPFRGVLTANGTVSGVVELLAKTESLTGEMRFVTREPVALTAGGYDQKTGSLQFDGGGYQFAGFVSGGETSGYYAAPGPSIGVLALMDSSSDEVLRYCGTFDYVIPVLDLRGHGVWNLARRNGRVLGVASGDAGAFPVGVVLSGRLEGSTLDLKIIDGDREAGTATGTASGGLILGTFSLPSSFTFGAWRATQPGCPPSELAYNQLQTGEAAPP